ncbi:hypothetical protein ig2599ANME_0295 [groundwater metagenome]
MSEIYSNILMGLRKVDGVKMTALGSRDVFSSVNMKATSLKH